MYDGIFEDVEHVKKVLGDRGHNSVDGTLVFELLENIKAADRVVEILLGRQIKSDKSKKENFPNIIGDLSNSSDDLEVIHHEIAAKPLSSDTVNLTIDYNQESIIFDQDVENNIEKHNNFGSNLIEPLIDLTGEIQNDMEVDKTCCSNVWSNRIESKVDEDVDSDDSTTESECEMDDYYRRPPSIESEDFEDFGESDNKVLLSPSRAPRISPSLENQNNNEVSNIEPPEEMLEENNNDPNNNLEDIEVLEQNNTTSTTMENLNIVKETNEKRCDSPKPGCSKDSYYADNDFCTTDSNDLDSETISHKNETFVVGERPNLAKVIDGEDKVDGDYEKLVNESMEQDVSTIRKILPNISKSKIWSVITEHKEAINRVEIALWELLPDGKPDPIYHPKRKQKEDDCSLPLKKFIHDDMANGESNPQPVSSTELNNERQNGVVKSPKLVVSNGKKNILTPPKFILNNSDLVSQTTKSSAPLLKPSKLGHLITAHKIPNNISEQSLHHFKRHAEGPIMDNDAVPRPNICGTETTVKKSKQIFQELRALFNTLSEERIQKLTYRPSFGNEAPQSGSKSDITAQSHTRIASAVNEVVRKAKVISRESKSDGVLARQFVRTNDAKEKTASQQKTGAIPKNPALVQAKVANGIKVAVETTESNGQQKTVTIPNHQQLSQTKGRIRFDVPTRTANSNVKQKTSAIPRYVQQTPTAASNRAGDLEGRTAAGPSRRIQEPQTYVLDHPEPVQRRNFKFEVYEADLKSYGAGGSDIDKIQREARLQAYADSLNKSSSNPNETRGTMPVNQPNEYLLDRLERVKNVEENLQRLEQPVDFAELDEMFERVGKRETIPPKELYNPLLNMFPDVDPNYISELCINAKAKNYSFESLVENLLTYGVMHPRIYDPQPEPQEVSPDSQYENLQGIFPDAQREYLREIAEHYYNDPEAMKNFVQTKLENPDYPKMADYLKKFKITEQIKQYTDDFSAENFLQLFPDPFTHFENSNRVHRYNVVAFEFLKCHFKQNKVTTIIRAYRSPMHPNNLTLAANLLEIIGPDMKRKRSDKQLPTEDIPLLQEIAFIRHKHAIKNLILTRKKQETEEFRKLKASNKLLECQCCYDGECMPSKCSSCNEGHVFCLTCIKAGAASKIGEGQTRIPCFAECQGEFTLPVLQKVLEPTMFSILLRKRQEEEVKAAGLEGLVSCPFCHFASIPPPEDKVFKCLNPECMKESCRLCKELNHVPLRCDEVIKVEEARHYLEEKMTEALVRKCYRCSRPFFKDEGCNKMTCPCGAMTCYICGEPVKDYKHFNGQGSTRIDLCPLWSDNNVLNAQTVRVIAEAAEKELLKKNPNLKIDAKSLMPALPQASVGPHQDIANGHVLPVQARRV